MPSRSHLKFQAALFAVGFATSFFITSFALPPRPAAASEVMLRLVIVPPGLEI